MAKMIQMPEEITAPTREEKWKYANFTDDFIFGHVLCEYPDITRKIIEMILPELEIDEFEIILREAREGPSISSKEAILDIKIIEKNGRITMIEMQNRKHPFFIGRTRYYRSAADVNILKPGDPYDLPDVIQIWICGFDPFDKGKYVYDFAYRDSTDSNISLEDGTRAIFLNAKGAEGDISDELKAFLYYVNGIEVDDPLCDTIDVSVKDLKMNDDIRESYMYLVDKLANERREGIEEGRAQGIAEEREALVIRHYENGRSPEEIASFLFMTVEEIQAVIDKAYSRS